MRNIPLTRGYVALVDDADYEELSQYDWYATYHASGPYAARGFGFDAVYMHRHLLQPAVATDEVDHLDGNRLNNQRSNLVLSTHAANTRNHQGANKNSTTGVRGVTWHARDRVYEVHITIWYKRYYVGRYQTLEEATEASRAARAEAFGAKGAKV